MVMHGEHKMSKMKEHSISEENLLELLIDAYPFLKHRMNESPQPELVAVVRKIELLINMMAE